MEVGGHGLRKQPRHHEVQDIEADEAAVMAGRHQGRGRKRAARHAAVLKAEPEQSGSESEPDEPEAHDAAGGTAAGKPATTRQQKPQGKGEEEDEQGAVEKDTTMEVGGHGLRKHPRHHEVQDIEADEAAVAGRHQGRKRAARHTAAPEAEPELEDEEKGATAAQEGQDGADQEPAPAKASASGAAKRGRPAKREPLLPPGTTLPAAAGGGTARGTRGGVKGRIKEPGTAAAAVDTTTTIPAAAAMTSQTAAAKGRQPQHRGKGKSSVVVEEREEEAAAETAPTAAHGEGSEEAGAAAVPAPPPAQVTTDDDTEEFEVEEGEEQEAPTLPPEQLLAPLPQPQPLKPAALPLTAPAAPLTAPASPLVPAARAPNASALQVPPAEPATVPERTLKRSNALHRGQAQAAAAAAVQHEEEEVGHCMSRCTSILVSEVPDDPDLVCSLLLCCTPPPVQLVPVCKRGCHHFNVAEGHQCNRCLPTVPFLHHSQQEEDAGEEEKEEGAVTAAPAPVAEVTAPATFNEEFPTGPVPGELSMYPCYRPATLPAADPHNVWQCITQWTCQLQNQGCFV
jgi:hypothetical protein